MSYAKRRGIGCTIGWDVTGGTSYSALATVIDGSKTDAKFKTVMDALLSEVADTYSKTSYTPGTFKFTLNYDPLSSEYIALKANFLLVNAVAPSWQLSFPATGSGSGATSESFAAHITGLGREVVKEKYLECEIELTISGPI